MALLGDISLMKARASLRPDLGSTSRRLFPEVSLLSTPFVSLVAAQLVSQLEKISVETYEKKDKYIQRSSVCERWASVVS